MKGVVVRLVCSLPQINIAQITAGQSNVPVQAGCWNGGTADGKPGIG
jgi:hypothetical protein